MKMKRYLAADMRTALRAIFDSYAHALPSASALLSRDA